MLVLNSGAANPSDYTPIVCGLNKKELLKDILHLFGEFQSRFIRENLDGTDLSSHFP
jgi:hypothetical protein